LAPGTTESVVTEDVHPTSTWDVFNIPIGTVPSSPLSQGIQLNYEGPPGIDSEKVYLLQKYQDGIGLWMDLFDLKLNYQRAVIKRAYFSPLIMKSLCALTAKQLSRVNCEEIWDPVAVRYYGESLRLLINVLADEESCAEDALTGTILLSSYELLASPGLDHRRHVSGALTLIKTHNFTAKPKGLARAAFWIYVRLDIAMALIHECPTMFPPEEWGVSWTVPLEEDAIANKMLWILAKSVAFTFQNGERFDQETLRTTRSELLAEIGAWFDALPPTFKGVQYGTRSREGFIKYWFAVTFAGQYAFQ
jgi:hypothetical protein